MISKYSFLFFIIFIFTNCQAPRNNPLDPENPDNKIVVIEGNIKSINVPQLPIEKVTVFWQNEGLITESNSEGYFRFENITGNDGWIIVEKENFSKDSMFVAFNNTKKITLDFFLNSIPKINNLKFYSITVNQFPNKQKYSLEVRANITDDENDIDSVNINLSDLGIFKPLLYNASTRYYQNTLSLDDLNLISIDAVIGKDFQINVVDLEGKNFEIGSTNIKRIIKQEIEISSPSGRDTVFTSNPFLEWRRFIPGFEYRYLVQIFTDEVPASLVWETELSSNEIELLTNANLQSGDYFWVIWAIDEFENRTRSKPASFIIK